jgi:hypothetical protein
MPPPFPPARDIDTEPGMGLLALKAENARLRRERDEAREELASSPSTPPPTRRQAIVGTTMGTVKWLGVLSLIVTAAVQIASVYRPGLVGPLQQLLQLLGAQ